MRGTESDQPIVAMKPLQWGRSEGADAISVSPVVNREREEPVESAKPFDIPKRLLVEAYRLVAKNGGAPGVDGQTIQAFEDKLKDNLYRLWNRMSSGSYIPSPVRRVDIPKKSGGTRPLGIPTVRDRIAQMAARLAFEPMLEPVFHPDSYGYRPGKSAHQALEKARRRCWERDWVIDLDIKGFFDTIDHELMLKAVDHHKPPKWVRLYAERWLKAPSRDSEGTVQARDMGTPQGGVISPLLANLFLHYAFDQWIERCHPRTPFERYADDIVIHCRTREEAETLVREIAERLTECRLTLHPEKTKIVYCKDQNRKGEYERIEFDFLGYTFRPRLAKSRGGKYFVSFSPAISKKAETSIREEVKGWKMHKKTEKDIEYLSRAFNPILRGWLEYYAKFRPSAMQRVCRIFQNILVKWAKNKYKGLGRSWRRAFIFISKIAQSRPKLFAHWERGWCLNG